MTIVKVWTLADLSGRVHQYTETECSCGHQIQAHLIRMDGQNAGTMYCPWCAGLDAETVRDGVDLADLPTLCRLACRNYVPPNAHTYCGKCVPCRAASEIERLRRKVAP